MTDTALLLRKLFDERLCFIYDRGKLEGEFCAMLSHIYIYNIIINILGCIHLQNY